MRIVKTEEDEKKIQEFVNMMSKMMYTYAFENPTADINKIYNGMKKDLFDSAGSIYLCFACATIMNRKVVKVENYFQINQVWHSCQGSQNNMSYPTAGVITRWNKILEHIEKISPKD